MNTEGLKGHQRQLKNLEFILKSDKIPQAILFTGNTGIGKKKSAKIFLNALFCKGKNPPCFTCPVCKQIAHETFPDMIEIVPNEKGIIPIGTEENSEIGSIRWLINKLSAKSISGKTGVLIDGIERATEEGQNALLKTIEDPSPGTCFVLISSNRNNLLQTILSRCIEIRFFPLSDPDLKEVMIKNNLYIETKIDSNAVSKGFDLDTISSISGGSIEIAKIIADEDNFGNILEFGRAISSFINEDKVFDMDISAVQNKIKSELFLDVLINIFRQNLLTIIKKNKNINPILKNIFIDDKKKVMNIIKILIFLKRSGSNNLNIKYAFKGLLYSYANSFASLRVNTVYTAG